jgi:hypothetical protein
MALCKHFVERRDCGDCNARHGVPLSLPAGEPEYGLWFAAQYWGRCAQCGEEIRPDDQIRSDGEGGWLGACCGMTQPGMLDVPVSEEFL